MMTDTFVEYMVKRKQSPKDRLVFIGTVVGAVLVLLVSIMVAGGSGIPMLPLFVLIGVGYLVYRVWMETNLEFEYSFTNGDITVDKILARRKRRQVVSFDAHNIEKIVKVTPNFTLDSDIRNVYRVGTLAQPVDGWCIVYTRDGSNRSALLFDPDERFINAMKPYLQTQVRFNAFGRH